jgi:hypothetical protein
MDDTDQPAPRRRRRRGKKPKPQRICCREGCNRVIQPGYNDRPACTFLCNVVAQELERAQRLCEALGGDTEHWLATVAFNDALTDYYRSDLRIYRAALEVGLPSRQ